MNTPIFPEFRELQVTDYEFLAAAAARRPSEISEGHPLNYILWQDFYHIQFSVLGEAVLFIVRPEDTYGALMPWCTMDEFPFVWNSLNQYFMKQLHLPMAMYLLDEEAATLMQSHPEWYAPMHLYEERDDEDYIYEASSLRTLRGKKYHKKKNHINAFLRNYGDDYEYVTLTPADSDEILAMYDEWLQSQEETEASRYIAFEHSGLIRVLQNSVPCRMAGIRIQGKLVAFTLGSYDEITHTAYVHIEKALATIPGLYTVINQQFQEFAYPDALWVNREDDMGEDGLRQSKLSYHPHHLAKKFHIMP